MLWIYGDSVSNRFYYSIIMNPLFKNVFKYSRCSYSWVYTLKKDLHPPRKIVTGKPFNMTRLLYELESVVSKPEMNEKSVLVLNYGLHYVRSLRLEQFKRMIDDVIMMLKTRFNGTLIWKTTTAVEMWKSASALTIQNRFLTEQVSTKKKNSTGKLLFPFSIPFVGGNSLVGIYLFFKSLVLFLF